ncbi:Zinc finger C2H2 [Penicillium odoratum]|uniref:Zinc finger C2H2 n=1 Tax=Penicillium odoratum TaxID=1167516 RepID=UPI002549046D|nr:Zinc finger C2H2 [Penicillium odoratum]KAJ5772119.1 Zinc finger C2H2 [Penicillium odoratum]
MRTQHDPTLSYVGNVVDFGEHSNNEIQRAVLPRTESGYSDKLLLFDKFVKLHPQAVIPPDIRTCRAFLEWIAKGMNGRIEERPTVETIKGFIRQFATGMKRERNFNFPEASRTTINEYILGELKAKIPLSTAQMNKDGGVSPNDLTILMTQLWCRDHHEYRGNPNDRARIQLSAAILLYCFTSARTGEVHESTARRKKAQDIGVDSEDAELEARVLAACYKHFELTVETVDVYAEDVPIFLNVLTFFLPMASADKAFRNYSSVSEILDAVEMYERVGPLEDKILEVIHVREEMRDMPVFRQYLEHNVDHFKGHARGADAFGKALVHLGHRSGYTLNITVRACRRWALQEADKTHSETARMRFAGQTNRDTYGKSYAHPLSEVDGPANYLGIASRQEHIQNRRGMGLYRNSSLSQLLPAKAEYEFLAREDICDLDRMMAKLSLQLSGATPEEKHKIQLQQKRVYNEKRGLYNKELRKVERQSGKQHGSIYTETMFHYRRRVMPHRDFLANALLGKVSLRSLDGRRILQALESLCSETHTVAYRDSLSPLDKACLCGKSIKE